MENQVTTIEQSRRLLELGVPAGKASMVWVTFQNDSILATKQQLHDDYYYVESSSIIKTPAYTVADLLGLMPSRLMHYEVSYFMTINREHEHWGLHWCHSQFDYIGYFKKTSLIDLLCGRIEWLLSNGYKLAI